MSPAGVAGELVPARFESLLAWALDGLARERTVFGYPRRAIWTGGTHDLSVAVPGGRAATPLGVAAGPHTQMAHNLVVSWLAGARVLELKTVQVLDRLELPRPCIDAPDEGYNVEWSQELKLEESLEQYVTAWALVHALAPRVLGTEAAAAALAGTRFDASVGYDLTGIRSEPVARFLDGLTDATASFARFLDRLPADLRPAWPEGLPARVIDTVTLSSFHGCPAGEIVDIVEHLFARHGVNVVVKLNPTLLGYDEVDELLHGPLGWRHVQLERTAFERDLQWDHAVSLLGRLRAAARRHSRTLGIKLTNTLVVRNTRGRLAGEAVYLSGAPLHPIAIRLAARLSPLLDDAVPLSLSAGVNAENFADAVACGFTPVTTCTDLLRPTGYRRLPRYLKALDGEMTRAGASDVAAYVCARARERGERADGLHAAARANRAAYAAQVGADMRYAAPVATTPAPARTPLALLDCESCNQCTLVCPNGAFFDVASPLAAADATATAGAPAGAAGAAPSAPPAPFVRERQWVLLADFCNSCGNCDTFCPQSGGPYRVKPRFHTSRAAWQRDRHAHAVWVQPDGRALMVRLGGHEYALEPRDGGWRVSSAAGDVLLDAAGTPVVPLSEPARRPLATLWLLHRLAEQASAEVNPLSTRY